MYRMLLVVLLAIIAALPTAAQAEKAKITLERTACFGRCPVYSVTLYEDGRVVYDGKNDVEVTGRQEINIGAEAFAELMQVIEDAGYFEWDDEYLRMTVTDHPYVMTSVTRGGETKAIQHYTGDGSAPLELSFVENWIDWAAGTQAWTGKEPFLPSFTSAGSAVISLERTPCFGTCPAYRLVIYEDGTVVFMGYRFVAETGIHVGQIGAEAVTALVEKIVAAGYFGWDDAYLDQRVTDLPTVYISVLGEADRKQIAHYLGDSGAPEALAEVEAMIDSAVNVSQWVAGVEATPAPEM